MSIVSIPKIVVAANFSPKTSVSGCQLWLDASDATTITKSGSSVTIWNDKSGNGYNMNTLTPTAVWTGSAEYPTIGTSINGLQTVNFSPQAGLKQSTQLDGVKNLFWVGRIAAPVGSGGGTAYFLLGNDVGYDWHGYPYGDRFLHPGAANVGILNASPTSLFTSDVNAITNATFSNVYKPSAPNVSILSVAGITGTTRYQGICYDRSNHIGWCGDLAEVIVYSTALSVFDRQQVEGYLANKWGLTSFLPPGHPGRVSTSFIPLAIVPYYTNYKPLTATGSTCILWLDASDPMTLFSDAAGTTPATVGGTVGYWKDKSSSGFNATQTTPSYKPTYLSAARNGKSVLSFNELTNFFNLPQFTAVPLTIFFVAQASVFIPNTFFLSLGNAGNTVMMCILYTQQKYGVNGGGVDGIAAIATTNADTNWHLWTLTISSSTVTLYFDGSLVGTTTWANGSGYTFATNTIASWNQMVGGQATTITMPEILFYSAVLGTTQQQTVESYLASKWLVTSQLPSTHLHFSKPAGIPYGTFQPSITSVAKFFRFLPTSISGCQLWLDAADPAGTGTPPSNGLTVATWKDKSGKGINSPANTTGATFNTNSQNGNGVLSFTTGQYYTTPSFIATANNTPTIFLVCQQTSYSGSGNSEIILASIGYAVFNIFGKVGTQILKLDIYGNTNESGSISIVSPTLISVVGTGSPTYTATMWGNGTSNASLTGSSANAMSTSSSYVIGAAYGFIGNIYEILFYDTPFSDPARQQVEGYLAQKWGLTASLPPGHPGLTTRYY